MRVHQRLKAALAMTLCWTANSASNATSMTTAVTVAVPVSMPPRSMLLPTMCTPPTMTLASVTNPMVYSKTTTNVA